LDSKIQNERKRAELGWYRYGSREEARELVEEKNGDEAGLGEEWNEKWILENGKGLVKISCERFPNQQMNSKWCGDRLLELIKEAEVSRLTVWEGNGGSLLGRNQAEVRYVLPFFLILRTQLQKSTLLLFHWIQELIFRDKRRGTHSQELLVWERRISQRSGYRIRNIQTHVSLVKKTINLTTEPIYTRALEANFSKRKLQQST